MRSQQLLFAEAAIERGPMTWEYLAGFTDGDGCLRQNPKRGHYPSVVWSQKHTNSAVLYAIANFLSEQGIGLCMRNFSVALKGHKYPQVNLEVHGNNAVRVIKRIAPHLTNKRELALRIIDIQSGIRRKSRRIHAA